MRLTVTALIAALLPLSAAHAQEQASANTIDTNEESVGTVTFEATQSGMVHIIAELTGLPPGPHGFHIHETGECSVADSFKSAGGHYAAGAEHGVKAEGGPHPGDLPNIHVGEDGILRVEFFTDRVSLADGENPLRDDDGSAVVIHASADDYSSQPSGDAGDRIACGVIE